MTISFTVPDAIEQQLQARIGPNLGQAAREAFAVEMYRQEKLSLGQVAQLLGLSINETDGFLKSRGVESFYTEDDLEQDRVSIEKALGR